MFGILRMQYRVRKLSKGKDTQLRSGLDYKLDWLKCKRDEEDW